MNNSKDLLFKATNVLLRIYVRCILLSNNKNLCQKSTHLIAFKTVTKYQEQ